MDDEHSLTCRACMRVAMELVHLESEVEEGCAYTLQDVFVFSTHLEVEKDDVLPHYLCSDCADELRVVFDFVQRARKTDSTLRKKLITIQIRTAEPDEEEEEEDEQIVTFTINELDVLDEKEHKFDSHTNDPDESKLEFNDPDTMEVIYPGESASDQEDDDVINDGKEIDLDEFPIEERLNESIDFEHPPEKHKYSCSQCAKQFSSKLGLSKHLKEFHRSTQYVCKRCGKEFTSRNMLKSHLLQHKDHNTYPCEYCDKKYFTKLGLRLHISQIHFGENTTKYVCAVCGKDFATKQRVEVHQLTHTGEKNYPCHLCEKRFGTAVRLKTHLRLHDGEKPYQCETCGIKFAQSNALKCHERIHTGEKPYECKVCGKCFNQSTILKTHMTLHTGKKVKCPQCNKLFSRPSCLILHQREHTGEKPYQCYKCPNKYKQKSHLDRHLDTHFGIKHKCNICMKEYSKRSSLNIHMFEHSDKKPFECPDCPMSFARKDKYRHHLQKIHKKVLVNNEVMEINSQGNEPIDTIEENLKLNGIEVIIEQE